MIITFSAKSSLKHLVCIDYFLCNMDSCPTISIAYRTHERTCICMSFSYHAWEPTAIVCPKFCSKVAFDQMLKVRCRKSSAQSMYAESISITPHLKVCRLRYPRENELEYNISICSVLSLFPWDKLWGEETTWLDYWRSHSNNCKDII